MTGTKQALKGWERSGSGGHGVESDGLETQRQWRRHDAENGGHAAEGACLISRPPKLDVLFTQLCLHLLQRDDQLRRMMLERGT